MSIPALIRQPDPTVAEFLRRHRLACAIGTLAWAALCWPTFVLLADFWSRDPDFSHGPLIPLISAFIFWTKRRELAEAPARRSALGLTALVAALVAFGVGYVLANHTLQRAGVWGLLFGSTWFLFGASFQRKALFPLGFLLLAFPPPYFILDPIRSGLKEIATRITTDLLRAIGTSARQSANILEVDGHYLEVADACSGIRSLMAITATAFLLIWVCRTGPWKGALVIATAIPVTVLINVLRILAVALGLSWFDVDLSRGLLHDGLGLVVFALSLASLYVSVRFFDWLLRWPLGSRSDDTPIGTT